MSHSSAPSAQGDAKELYFSDFGLASQQQAIHGSQCSESPPSVPSAPSPAPSAPLQEEQDQPIIAGSPPCGVEQTSAPCDITRGKLAEEIPYASLLGVDT